MSKNKHIGESAFGELGMDFESIESLKEVKIDLIEPPLWQPRKVFEIKKLEELKNSIKEHGLLQPIVLEKINNGRYRVVSGERRYRALKELGTEYIQARIVSSLSEPKRLQIQIAENLMREDITPIERAKAVFKLLSISQKESSLEKILNLLVDYGKDRSRLSSETANTVLAVLNALGKSHMTIYRWLQLLKLPEKVQDMLNDPNGPLTPKHAGELLKLDDIKTQLDVAKMVEEMNLTAEQTKEIVQEKINKGKSTTPQLAYRSGLNFIKSLNTLDYEKLQTEEKSEYLSKIEQLRNELDKIISDMKKIL
ncbi:MAG TPA: ParB/RepB/Spo0J family partition protein [Caldisericia bacterium]|nr:ParB/RepB/Spo0J family partition protein [Caldisericia bacterium]HQL69036.1 ParB/RepB/Spo0J family partition protein [Caldisericia bacterium]HUN19444.1 ParB/RepB/Spo0J family partition protein [Caldisericia bacterium]